MDGGLDICNLDIFLPDPAHPLPSVSHPRYFNQIGQTLTRKVLHRNREYGVPSIGWGLAGTGCPRISGLLVSSRDLSV